MRALVAVIVGAVLLAGCDRARRRRRPRRPPPRRRLRNPATAVELYFTAGEQLRPVPDPGDPSGADLERTMRSLLAGPGADAPKDARTEIPNGVEVEHVSVDDRGTATVEVSKRFTSGVPTEPAKRSPNQEAELDARLAQVTYTLAQFDDVERTRLVSGGVPVGGVQGRDDFAKPEPKAPKHEARGAEAEGQLIGERQIAAGAARPDSGTCRRAPSTGSTATGRGRPSSRSRPGRGCSGTGSPARRRRRRSRPPGARSRRATARRSGSRSTATRASRCWSRRDRTKRAVHTSSGAPGYTTPAGRFEVFRKEVNSWSVPYQTWLPLASYFNAGIAFHAYPDVPPYPLPTAASGCPSRRPSTSTRSRGSGRR